MTTRLIRAFSTADLAVSGDGRTIVGIAVPFGEQAVVGDADGFYREEFRRGAFARTIAERGNRVKILAQHNYDAWPIGRATLLREDPHGLYMEARISQTRAGDEALELIKDGALDSFSIGFRSIRAERGNNGVTVRTEVRLNEVSIVSFPAYEGATIMGVRAHRDPTPYLTLARARLALVEATLTTKGDR